MQHIMKKIRNTYQNNLKFVKIFGPTAEEVAKDLNFENKVCLITGASNGIGLEITRCLTSGDCNVLMTCRNPYVARNTTKSICKNFDRLAFYEVNLASLASVQKCVKSLLQSQNSSGNLEKSARDQVSWFQVPLVVHGPLVENHWSKGKSTAMRGDINPASVVDCRLQHHRDAVGECRYRHCVCDARSIDIVILNAATFGLPWTLTENGLETTFQVNFLSQYFLLLSIENVLSPNARVVFTSSESHRNVKLSEGTRVFPLLDHFSLSAESYTSIRAYNLSKVCGVLAARYLHQRWLRSGRAVFCAHPGSFVKTGLCRNWWVYEVLYTTMLPFSKTIEQAASTILYCATSPELAGQSGFYFKDCERCEPSELAASTYLAYRIHDLACDVLQQRGFHLDETLARDVRETEHEIIEEQIC